MNMPFLMRRLAVQRDMLNPPLIIGGVLVLAIVVCALAAPLLAPHDPLDAIVRFNGKDLVPAPYPPGTLDMPLGSDMDRRDMLSQLLYGARYTLLFAGVAASVRLVFGATMGMLAGWSGRAARLIDPLAAATAAIPGLVFGLVLVVLLRRNGDFGTTLLIAALLGFVGWSDIAVRCRVATQALRKSAFVEAAGALGVGSFGMLWRHVLPNLRGVLLAEAAYALTSALLLLAELGFLNVFLSTVNEDGLPAYAEWGMMIASGFRARAYGSWLIWEPMLVFAITILAFYLLAEGLRQRR